MKTDKNGGSTVGDSLEQRLARQFEVELDRAEQDYPTFGPDDRAALARPNQPRRRWPSVAALLVIVAVVAIVVPLSSNHVTAPAEPAGPVSPGAGVVLGPDGIPNQIDGQTVYRIGDNWHDQTGSFLLGGYVMQRPLSCASVDNRGSKPLSDLVADCAGVSLSSSSSGQGNQWLLVAPIGSDVLTPWVGGWSSVVLRAHTRDPEAAQCTIDQRATCEAAVVVESVVWPVVPTEIAGERVYRAVDQASFPTSGSFLLGGQVTMPDVLSPCPMPIDHTTAENDLIPYCYWEAIDGIHLAPKVDALADLRDRIVVARVHINDPEASGCPTAVQAECKAAVVVEEVVWTGGPSPSSTLGPTPIATSPLNPASAGQGEAASQPANSGFPTPLLALPSALPVPSATPMRSGT